MARIRIQGRDDEIEAGQGSSLLSCLMDAQVPISTSCGGQGICGLCRLTVVKGRELLTPVNGRELGHIGNVAKVVNIRLACQAAVIGEGELELNVPPVVDVVARKREQTRRGFAERASRRHAPSGGVAESERGKEGDKRVSYDRIEWRPRKIAEAQQREQREREQRQLREQRDQGASRLGADDSGPGIVAADDLGGSGGELKG